MLSVSLAPYTQYTLRHAPASGQEQEQGPTPSAHVGENAVGQGTSHEHDTLLYHEHDTLLYTLP